MNILGLDLSTSICGYCILAIDKKEPLKFIKYDFIDINKIVDDSEADMFRVFDKIYAIYPLLEKMIVDYNVEKVFVEAPLKVFKAGLSNVDTIAKLVLINYTICDMIKRNLKKPVTHLGSKTARNVVFGKGFNSPVLAEHGDIKEIALNNLIFTYPELSTLKEYKNKNGKLQPYIYDISDSIIIAIAGGHTKYLR
jgi:Holliday junction resolvasome RuvABC endonuclease subunit